MFKNGLNSAKRTIRKAYRIQNKSVVISRILGDLRDNYDALIFLVKSLKRKLAKFKDYAFFSFIHELVYRSDYKLRIQCIKQALTRVGYEIDCTRVSAFNDILQYVYMRKLASIINKLVFRKREGFFAEFKKYEKGERITAKISVQKTLLFLDRQKQLFDTVIGVLREIHTSPGSIESIYSVHNTFNSIENGVFNKMSHETRLRYYQINLALSIALKVEEDKVASTACMFAVLENKHFGLFLTEQSRKIFAEYGRKYNSASERLYKKVVFSMQENRFKSSEVLKVKLVDCSKITDENIGFPPKYSVVLYNSVGKISKTPVQTPYIYYNGNAVYSLMHIARGIDKKVNCFSNGKAEIINAEYIYFEEYGINENSQEIARLTRVAMHPLNAHYQIVTANKKGSSVNCGIASVSSLNAIKGGNTYFNKVLQIASPKRIKYFKTAKKEKYSICETQQVFSDYMFYNRYDATLVCDKLLNTKLIINGDVISNGFNVIAVDKDNMAYLLLSPPYYNITTFYNEFYGNRVIAQKTFANGVCDVKLYLNKYIDVVTAEINMHNLSNSINKIYVVTRNTKNLKASAFRNNAELARATPDELKFLNGYGINADDAYCIDTFTDMLTLHFAFTQVAVSNVGNASIKYLAGLDFGDGKETAQTLAPEKIITCSNVIKYIKENAGTLAREKSQILQDKKYRRAIHIDVNTQNDITQVVEYLTAVNYLNGIGYSIFVNVQCKHSINYACLKKLLIKTDFSNSDFYRLAKQQINCINFLTFKPIKRKNETSVFSGGVGSSSKGKPYYLSYALGFCITPSKDGMLYVDGVFLPQHMYALYEGNALNLFNNSARIIESGYNAVWVKNDVDGKLIIKNYVNNHRNICKNIFIENSDAKLFYILEISKIKTPDFSCRIKENAIELYSKAKKLLAISIKGAMFEYDIRTFFGGVNSVNMPSYFDAANNSTDNQKCLILAITPLKHDVTLEFILRPRAVAFLENQREVYYTVKTRDDGFDTFVNDYLVHFALDSYKQTLIERCYIGSCAYIFDNNVLESAVGKAANAEHIYMLAQACVIYVYQDKKVKNAVGVLLQNIVNMQKECSDGDTLYLLLALNALCPVLDNYALVKKTTMLMEQMKERIIACYKNKSFKFYKSQSKNFTANMLLALSGMFSESINIEKQIFSRCGGCITLVNLCLIMKYYIADGKESSAIEILKQICRYNGDFAGDLVKTIDICGKKTDIKHNAVGFAMLYDMLYRQCVGIEVSGKKLNFNKRIIDDLENLKVLSGNARGDVKFSECGGNSITVDGITFKNVRSVKLETDGDRDILVDI